MLMCKKHFLLCSGTVVLTTCALSRIHLGICHVLTYDTFDSISAVYLEPSTWNELDE